MPAGFRPPRFFCKDGAVAALTAAGGLGVTSTFADQMADPSRALYAAKRNEKFVPDRQCAPPLVTQRPSPKRGSVPHLLLKVKLHRGKGKLDPMNIMRRAYRFACDGRADHNSHGTCPVISRS